METANEAYIEQQYDDFILKCDVRWEAKHCNSGIFFRVSDPKNPVHTGFEVQVMSGNGTGKHDCGAIYDLVGTNVNMGRPTGEWNSVEIDIRGVFQNDTDKARITKVLFFVANNAQIRVDNVTATF